MARQPSYIATMSKPPQYIPFSQRAGLSPLPPQLRLGEVSEELRRLIYYAINLEIDRESSIGYSSSNYFREKWLRVAKYLHVRFFKQPADTFENKSYEFDRKIKKLVYGENIGILFDFVEFLVRHPGCGEELKRDLRTCFVDSRAAYRVVDDQYIAAVGTEEQAASFERAMQDAEKYNATGARKQLTSAAVALRNGDWAGSVRDSIHSVESVARQLAPSENTLGGALRVIEKRGHLHGALKAAFDKLYGYSSDAEGVRHALVFEREANVDEVDALFMLGACASFVTYLLARTAEDADDISA